MLLVAISLQYRLTRSGKVTDVLQIVADTHERRSGIPTVLQQLGAHVSIRSLSSGDYVVGTAAAVERKTIVDLHLTLREGRFWRQIGRLRSTYRRCYLLVEGPSLGRPDGLPLESIRGALLAVSELGLIVVRSEDRDDSAAWLARIARRLEGVPPRDRPIYAQRPRRTGRVSPAEQALAAAPGVSTVTARALLSRFGSLRNVVSARSEELETVPGLGPVRTRSLLRMIDDQWLTADTD